MQEGGFLCWKGVPRGFVGQFVCSKEGGSCAGRGFLWGAWDSSCAGKGGFLSGMHMTQPYDTMPSSSPQTTHPLRCDHPRPLATSANHIFGPLHCKPLEPMALRLKGDRVSTCWHAHQKPCSCATLVLRTIAPAAINKLGWCHLHPVHKNVTALLGTPGESSEAAVQHHPNAPRRHHQQGVVLRSRPGQPLALVCMARQWAVFDVSGNHIRCVRCLVMPGVKRRPVRWNQRGDHVVKGEDMTRSAASAHPRSDVAAAAASVSHLLHSIPV